MLNRFIEQDSKVIPPSIVSSQPHSNSYLQPFGILGKLLCANVYWQNCTPILNMKTDSLFHPGLLQNDDCQTSKLCYYECPDAQSSLKFLSRRILYFGTTSPAVSLFIGGTATLIHRHNRRGGLRALFILSAFRNTVVVNNHQTINASKSFVKSRKHCEIGPSGLASSSYFSVMKTEVMLAFFED